MRKNQYNRRADWQPASDSARGARYAFTSASSRRDDSNISGHSLHEMASASGGKRANNRQTQPFSANTRSSGTSRKKKKTKSRTLKKRWYAVVRGHVPGVYDDWQIAWAQTDGFSEARPYKASTRQEAVEIFMRWHAGYQLHPTSSTMAQRGEIIGEFANSFLGSVGAEKIRRRAYAKLAHERNEKYKDTGDPIWGPGSLGARSAHPVEVSRKATTPDSRVDTRHPRRKANLPTTGASRKEGGSDSLDGDRRRHDDKGTNRSAIAGGLTTDSKSPAHTTMGGVHPNGEPIESGALDSPRGAEHGDGGHATSSTSVSTGEAHIARSPMGRADADGILSGLNSGAVKSGVTKYAGRGNSSFDDEPQPQKTVIPPETRDPPDNNRQHTHAPPRGEAHSAERRQERDRTATRASPIMMGADVGGRSEGTRDTTSWSESTVPPPKDKHNTGGPSSHSAAVAEVRTTTTGSSTEADRATARNLFQSSESTRSNTSHDELASAEAALRTLEAWGFSTISKKEAERRKRAEVDRLDRERELRSLHRHPRPLIPKKKRTKAQRHGEAVAPVPIAVSAQANVRKREASKVPKTGKMRSKSKLGPVKPDPDGGRKGESKRRLRRIIEKRERQLAEAVLAARSNESEEEAMMQRILQHGPKPRQRYWRRLRKAEYFEDSSDPDEEFARRHAGSDSPEEKPDASVWHGEPGANMWELRAKFQAQLDENKLLKEQLEEIKSLVQDLRRDAAAKHTKPTPPPTGSPTTGAGGGLGYNTQPL